MAEIVTDGGGSIVVNERMGRQRLAYPIQKHEEGVYVRLLYDSAGAVPHELERRGRANGLQGLERWNEGRLREIEPHVRAVAGAARCLRRSVAPARRTPPLGSRHPHMDP